MTEQYTQNSARPTIPYEHPGTAMYYRLFIERLHRLRLAKRAYERNDRLLQNCFADEQLPLAVQCDTLVRYIAEAFNHYRVYDGSHAYYPGLPSQQNARTDAMEGCSRVLPTLAAWLHHAQAPDGIMEGLNGQRWDIVEWLKKAFLAGTQPTHPGYWGTLHDYDQRICESADLALALWLSKQWLWATLTVAEQRQIIAWFRQVSTKKTVDNNWHLFGLMVDTVLSDLGDESTINAEKYQRVKAFYSGDGWFRDGLHGNYDYYNAWGFHYALYWMDQINPQFDREFIHQTLKEFTTSYRNLITPEGIAFFGRSACYRLAASAPLVALASQAPNAQTLGEAKRALETTLRFFISRGAMKAGAPTQGLFGNDTRLVDNYSGPASSFWSLRALNIALYSAPLNRLWQAESRPLPIEKGDIDVHIEAIPLRIIGSQQTGEVVALFLEDYCKTRVPLSNRLAKQRWHHWLLERISGRAERPKNNLLRKGVNCYSSRMDLFI